MIDASYGDSTQLVFLRARYYNPRISQFTQPDTIVPDTRIPADWNRYAYVRNNPVNYVDPSGFIAEKNYEAARNIVNDLKTYNVRIKVDWGYQYDLFHTQCGWNEGSWIMPDLKAIQAGVHIMDKGVTFLGGNFKSLIGSPSILVNKGGKDRKGDPANENPAGTVDDVITWRVPNWFSEEYRLFAVVHEMGHIVAFNDRPQMINYFMSELGASCGNQKSYCNTDEDPTIIYDPGKLAGLQNDPYKYMPSTYARHGSYEDFAETWREVVVGAYILSGDTTYIRQARLVYNYNNAPYALNHDIRERQKVMNSIINGSWK